MHEKLFSKPTIIERRHIFQFHSLRCRQLRKIGTSFHSLVAFSWRLKRLSAIAECSAFKSHSENIFIILRFVVGISDVHSHIVIAHFAHTIPRVHHKPHPQVQIAYKKRHNTTTTRREEHLDKKNTKYSRIDSMKIRAQKMHSDSDVQRSRSYGAVTTTTGPILCTFNWRRRRFFLASYYCYRIFRTHYIQLTKWQWRIAQQHYSFELCEMHGDYAAAAPLSNVDPKSVETRVEMCAHQRQRATSTTGPTPKSTKTKTTK